MDSVDALVAITLFFYAFITFQQYLPNLERIPYLYDPFFLCSAGSPGTWAVSDGVPGMGYAYRRCSLDEQKVSSLLNNLNNDTDRVKERMGIEGANLSLKVIDYNNGTEYYSYTEVLNQSNIYRYEIPATLNSTLVKIVLEVGFS